MAKKSKGFKIEKTRLAKQSITRAISVSIVYMALNAIKPYMPMELSPEMSVAIAAFIERTIKVFLNSHGINLDKILK